MSEQIQEQDPWSPENLAISQFIMTCRLYDIMAALLKLADADLARDILELHSQGTIVGTAPSFNGTFLTDLMNGQDLGEANAEGQNDSDASDDSD